MRRKILLLICLITGGILAYNGGYYAYQKMRPKSEILIPEEIMYSGNMPARTVREEYYLGKIEQEMLMIYKMPEETVYDSIELSSLNFYGEEKDQFEDGVIFRDLIEVFEFLENSMS